MPREPFALKHGNVFIVPVCHYQMEFAQAVRQAIRHFQPAQIAVELPPSVRERYLEGVKRLPYLSVLVYGPENSPELLPIDPCDAFVEAIRSGLERDAQLHFVDVALDYPEIWEPMPDSHAVYHIGLEEYWNAYAELAEHSPRSPQDEVRESHMAWEISTHREGGPLLLVCGMAHARGVLRHLENGTGQRARGNEPTPVAIFNPHEGMYSILSIDTPFCGTVYQIARGGLGPEEAWKAPEPVEPQLKSTRLDQIDRSDAISSLEKLLGMTNREALPGKPEPHWSQEFKRLIAAKLQEMKQKQLDVNSLLEGGLERPPELEGAPAPPPRHLMQVFKFKNCNDRKPELKRTFAELAQKYFSPDGYLDRHRLVLSLWEIAARHYSDNTGEEVKQWQRRVMRQFVRNYTSLLGDLLPTVYQSMVGARGVADDNYGWEVWELGHFYPWADSSGTLDTIEIAGDYLNIGGRQIRIDMIRFDRRIPRLRERPLPIKGRKKEENPGEWAEEFNEGHICSYPPEDIIIEDYGRYLQKKAITVMSEERTRVEPFTSSLLDGLDMRETIRNWAEGHQLYVRETQKVQGGTGSVVLIFDEDLQDRRFPWKMTWHGEHAQESDMAFYATPSQAKIVGPGIARCEYGGLMLTYPPRRLLDVWRDSFYLGECQTKAEILLLAGLEYSEDKHVAYVAAKPPRTKFRTIAAKLNRKIVYLPIGQLSPVSLKKIRVFHVLSGHRLRKIAKDYIW